MATVFDVAAYVLERMGTVTGKKLQKLVYYAQAWSVAWGEGPLFTEPIEAWEEGPVVRPLWEAHRGLFWVRRITGGDPRNLTQRQKECIDAVLSVYSSLSPEELSDMTHKERPWIEAWENEWTSNIHLNAMREYYDTKTAERLRATGVFLRKTLLARVPVGERRGEVSWGEPVGREVW